MIQKLKEAVETLKSKSWVDDYHETYPAIKTLLDFATLAIESEGKWPMKIIKEKEMNRQNNTYIIGTTFNPYEIGSKENEIYRYGYNKAIDACLAVHASEKAEWEKKLLTSKEKIRDALSEKIIDVLSIGVANTYVDINKFADALANIVYKQLENAAQQKNLEGK